MEADHITYSECSTDNDDSKYFAGLSTILVATLQEVKDRISQIEFIFCSQLFPSFQSRSRSLQKRLAEARKAAEDDWKEKEKALLHKIEELQLENCRAQEQNRNIVTSLEQKINSMNNEQLLHACETEKKLLLAKLESLENNGVHLQEELRHKTEDVSKGKDLQDKLLQQIDLMNFELSIEKEKRKETKDGFLKMKRQLKETKSQYEYLLQRYGLISENKFPVSRMGLEMSPLNHHLSPGSSSGSKNRDADATQLAPKPSNDTNKTNFQEKLEDNGGVKSIQNSKSPIDIKLPLKSSLFHEKKCVFDAKPGPMGSKNGETDATQLAPKTGTDSNKTNSEEKFEDNRGVKSIQHSSSPSNIKLPSNSSSFHEKKDFVDVKPVQLAGLKRPIPRWRDTRSCQEPGGADLHDDFLDTPLENVKREMNKALKEEIQDFPVQAPEDMNFNNSDDETQDIDAGPVPQMPQCSILRPESRGFKYVGPVRKKADREKLKGVECKQCKKFYDAVGCGEKNDTNNFRCEHLDGVSRHRYKYVPPMTPEGFWNIGFESEL